MERCLWLASLGAGSVAPNPMVGCVIVSGGRIIGEGFHRECGGPHAEVHAIGAVKNQELLRDSTLYVSLEPCTHFGKTPPCSDLIIEKGVPRVVVGLQDPFPAVAGKGIKKMTKAGIRVEVGILEKECRELNRRFLTFHEKKRPYIILKWAQTLDGFMDDEQHSSGVGHSNPVTGELANRMVHRQRACEGAVLVGTRTAWLDDPALTVREWSGTNPLRLVIDRKCSLPGSLKLFNSQADTVVFNEVKQLQSGNVSFEKLDFAKNVPLQIAERLYERKVLSLVVEGGTETLSHFISQGLWDEAHIYTGSLLFCGGIKAPGIKGTKAASECLDDTLLTVLRKA